jgi:regulator of protease activity HflC (stomatin/prohibitin superfamily)
MNSTLILQTIAGFIVAVCITPAIRGLFSMLFVQVEDEHAVLIIKFGKLERTILHPGAHFLPSKALPWVKAVPVSLQRDFRHYKDIHVNDRRGTTVIVDLWIEFRVMDPARALFQVENWERSLQSMLTHSATSILGTQEFHRILENRTELGSTLKQDVMSETTRWGLQIEEVFIRQVSLLPEVSRQMFESVGAKLERARDDVREEGRLRVSLLEAQTSARIAELVAEAKGQYPAAIGRAYEELSKDPEVFTAYRELYDLSLVRPHRTISFQGFAEGEIRPIDAAMVAPPTPESVPPGLSPAVSPLSSSEDKPYRGRN